MKTASHETAEAFDRLFQDNQAKVFRLALGLTGNVNEAEEITQEAFYRAFRSFHTFRGSSSFFTWIYRITLNVAKNHIKQRSKMPVLELTEDFGWSIEQIIDRNPAHDPETELLARDARFKCLHCITECLPTNQRLVFCLTITLGLPQKQVAEILDLTVGSVKTTLHRAKKRWAGYMENRCDLIKKSNPCNCGQWVRFGLEQGWISKQSLTNPRSPVNIHARNEIVQMQTLRDTYQSMYHEKADEALIKRIKHGINNKEWSIFS